MPTRDAAPAGAPCWIDLMCSDTENQRSFYSEIFGWKAEEQRQEFGGCFMWTRDGVEIAGGMPAQPDEPVPCRWSVYLAVDDVEKTLEVATSAGAQVIVPRMEVGDAGIMGVLIDPTGAVIGVWQPKEFPGLKVTAEYGAPTWFELLTRDYDTAVA